MLIAAQADDIPGSDCVTDVGSPINNPLPPQVCDRLRYPGDSRTPDITLAKMSAFCLTKPSGQRNAGANERLERGFWFC